MERARSLLLTAVDGDESARCGMLHSLMKLRTREAIKRLEQ
jgi:hypothetical protein